MNSYAMTYPQLINQAIDKGFSGPELELLSRAHQFSAMMSEGIYRAQRVPLLCHQIRTASIVLHENRPMPVIIAALLHASYFISFFKGSCRQRPRRAHRKQIQREFGAEVDELIFQYARVSWYSCEAIDEHIKQIDDYDEQMKNLLLLRLANELEDYLDKAMAYTNAERIKYRINSYGPHCVELAHRLDATQLAEHLQATCEVYKSIQLPQEVVSVMSSGYETPVKRLWQAGFIELGLIRVLRTLKRLTK